MSGRATPAVRESSPAYACGSAKKRGGSTPCRAIVVADAAPAAALGEVVAPHGLLDALVRVAEVPERHVGRAREVGEAHDGAQHDRREHGAVELRNLLAHLRSDGALLLEHERALEHLRALGGCEPLPGPARRAVHAIEGVEQLRREDLVRARRLAVALGEHVVRVRVDEDGAVGLLEPLRELEQHVRPARALIAS